MTLVSFSPAGTFEAEEKATTELEAQPARIHESHTSPGRSFKVVAPGGTYSMIGRKTLTGAIRLAKRLYPGKAIVIFKADGSKLTIAA